MLKKISKTPFLLGIEKTFISKEEFYFDDKNFYAINKDLKKVAFKLCDISEIKKTEIKLNNRYIWQVKIKQANDKKEIFKFAHNYTLWNKNFALFYKKVKKLNPQVLKSKWSLWTM